jgi:hypothetical protein
MTVPIKSVPPERKRRWFQFSRGCADSKRLIFAIPLAFILADAAAFRFLDRLPTGESAVHAWLAPLIQSQVALLSLWASLSTSRRIVRWTALIGGVIALAGVASWAYHDLDEMRAIALGFYAITAAGITLTLAGAHLETTFSPSLGSGHDRRHPLQFSLRDLLELITALALLNCLAQFVLLPVKLNGNVISEIVCEAPVAILFSAIALLLLWGVLGWRLRAVAWALVGASMFLVQFWPIHIPTAGSASPEVNAGVVALTVAIEVLSLAVCRFCGVRLRRPQSETHLRPPGSAVVPSEPLVQDDAR